MSKVAPESQFDNNVYSSKNFDDLPKAPAKYDPLSTSAKVAAVLTCGATVRSSVDTYVLDKMHQSFRALSTTDEPSGPQVVKTGKTSVLLNGAAAREMLTTHEPPHGGSPWAVAKNTAGGPFAIQHEPYVESAGNSTLFTSEAQGDHAFFAQRMPLFDEALTEAWLEKAVPHMSVVAAERIRSWAKASSGGLIPAQDSIQSLVHELWQTAFFGEEPKGYSTYDDFLATGAAVDSGIANPTATCCPFASKLSWFRFNKTNLKEAKKNAALIDGWISKYRSDALFREKFNWTLLARMVDDPKYCDAHEHAWDHPGHGPYSVEIALDLWAAHFGGVFSGSHAIVSALVGVAQDPDLVLELRLALEAAIGDAEDANTLGKTTKQGLESCDMLLKVIAEGIRLRHPVPIIQRVCGGGGVTVNGCKLPEKTTAVFPTRALGHHAAWGTDEDKDTYDVTRWTDALMEEHASRWEVGTEAFAPFGFGARRCYGRRLAMATMRLVVARIVVDTQLTFDKSAAKKGNWPKEGFFYGTASYPALKMSLSVRHKRFGSEVETEGQDETAWVKTESGVGMGIFSAVIAAAIDIKPASERPVLMSHVKIPTEDRITLGREPITREVKVGDCVTLLNDEDSERVPDFAKTVVGLISDLACISADTGPSFTSPAAELAYIKEAFPNVISSSELTAGTVWPGGPGKRGTEKLFTHSIGAPYLTNVGDGFLYVDLSALESVKMRPVYNSIGCKAKFTMNGELVSIVKAGREFTPADDDKPGDHWRKAMLCLRSSTIIYLTLANHLCYTHLWVSNYALLAVRRALLKDHPLRRLLTPFLYNTGEINQGAALTLMFPGSIAHRLSGIDEESWPTAFAAAHGSWKYQTFEEDCRARKMSPEDGVAAETYPFMTEGIALWNCIKKFVDEFLALHFPTDADVEADAQLADYAREFGTLLKCPEGRFDNQSNPGARTRAAVAEFATLHMWYVSGYHEFAGGQLGLLVQTPGLAPAAFRTWDFSDTKTSWHALLPPIRNVMIEWQLIEATQGRNPMLREDFGHVMEGIPKEEESRAMIAKFCGETLGALADEMEARNAKRTWPLRMFHPDRLESSVSV